MDSHQSGRMHHLVSRIRLSGQKDSEKIDFSAVRKVYNDKMANLVSLERRSNDIFGIESFEERIKETLIQFGQRVKSKLFKSKVYFQYNMVKLIGERDPSEEEIKDFRHFIHQLKNPSFPLQIIQQFSSLMRVLEDLQKQTLSELENKLEQLTKDIYKLFSEGRKIQIQTDDPIQNEPQPALQQVQVARLSLEEFGVKHYKLPFQNQCNQQQEYINKINVAKQELMQIQDDQSKIEYPKTQLAILKILLFDEMNQNVNMMESEIKSRYFKRITIEDEFQMDGLRDQEIIIQSMCQVGRQVYPPDSEDLASFFLFFGNTILRWNSDQRIFYAQDLLGESTQILTSKKSFPLAFIAKMNLACVTYLTFDHDEAIDQFDFCLNEQNWFDIQLGLNEMVELKKLLLEYIIWLDDYYPHHPKIEEYLKQHQQCEEHLLNQR